jgi:hypothetical protein
LDTLRLLNVITFGVQIEHHGSRLRAVIHVNSGSSSEVLKASLSGLSTSGAESFTTKTASVAERDVS